MKVLYFQNLWFYKVIKNYLLVYDIKDKNTKYTKIYKLLNKYYSHRLQKSVFLIQEEQKEVYRFIKELKKIINPDEDKLILIPLCDDDWQAITMYGVNDKIGIDKKEFVIL